MNNLYFMDLDGKYKPVGHVEEVELTCDGDPEEYSRLLKSETMEFTATIENPEEFEKHIVYGGDKGRYNGHVLHRDGYLSQKNGSIDENDGGR